MNTIWQSLKLTSALTSNQAALAANNSVTRCPNLAKANGYVYNSMLSNIALGKASKGDPTGVWMIADGQNVTAGTTTPNVAFALSDISFARHANNYFAAALDGHVEMVKGDSQSSYDWNARAGIYAVPAPVPTSYLGNRQAQFFDNCPPLVTVTPTNFLFGGGFYDTGSAVALQTTADPGGYSLSATGFTKESSYRLPNINMAQVSLPPNIYAATDNGTPVVVTLNMNIPYGQSAILHIAWGYHCHNTKAGGDLTVVDVTNNKTFNSLTAPNDFKRMIGNNIPGYANEMTFTVGSCKQMTITLAPYNDWNQTSVADIQAIWLESVPVI